MAGEKIILVQEEPRGPSQLVEIPVPTNGASKVFLPDIQQLRSTAGETIIVKAIRLITVDVLTGGIISLAANAPITELQKLTLVLYCEGWEKGENIPLLTLNDMQAPGSTAPHRYHQTRFSNWRKVDWTKSFLQWVNGTSSAGTPYVVMLDVEYIKLNAANQEIVGPS